MLPLYEDPWFTFHFAGARVIPRFHLEGAPSGQRIDVFRLDPETGARLDRLATGIVGADGWVDLSAPIVVAAGDAFVAMPAKESAEAVFGR